MTIAVGHTVVLTDADAVQVSTARAARIAVEVCGDLGVITPPGNSWADREVR